MTLDISQLSVVSGPVNTSSYMVKSNAFKRPFFVFDYRTVGRQLSLDRGPVNIPADTVTGPVGYHYQIVGLRTERVKLLPARL